VLAAPFETQGKRALEESNQYRHPERSADGEERGFRPGLSYAAPGGASVSLLAKPKMPG